MASDPVELAAKTRIKAWHPHGDESFEAYRRRLITAQLDAIREDGWQIVRTESAGLWDHPDHVRPLYEDEDHDGGRELFLIDQEWTPEAPS